jgi:hypothetical protein
MQSNQLLQVSPVPRLCSSFSASAGNGIARWYERPCKSKYPVRLSLKCRALMCGDGGAAAGETLPCQSPNATSRPIRCRVAASGDVSNCLFKPALNYRDVGNFICKSSWAVDGTETRYLTSPTSHCRLDTLREMVPAAWLESTLPRRLAAL